MCTSLVLKGTVGTESIATICVCKVTDPEYTTFTTDICMCTSLVLKGTIGTESIASFCTCKVTDLEYTTFTTDNTCTIITSKCIMPSDTSCFMVRSRPL